MYPFSYKTNQGQFYTLHNQMEFIHRTNHGDSGPAQQVIQVECRDRILRCPGRKDRHSKVSTARGARDRRVRLSPKTAIQFYDVQDRLGYERPSEAIDWLMQEAKAAIEALDDARPPLPLPPLPAPTNDDENNYYYYQPPPCSATVFCQENGYFSAPLTDHDSEVFDSEIERMQRIFGGGCNNDDGRGVAIGVGEFYSPTPVAAVHFPATPVFCCQGEIFSHREPLQSSNSYSRMSTFPSLSSQFPQITDEFSDIISTVADTNY